MEKGCVVYYDAEKECGIVMDVFLQRHYFHKNSIMFPLEEITPDMPVYFELKTNLKGRQVARNIQKCY